MSAHLSDDELAEFREIFNLVDRDGGGTITKEELGELMDTLGIDATPEEIDLMINEIDTDNNGEIDFEEFVAVMSRKVNATYSSEQVKNAFKVFEGTSGTPGYVKEGAAAATTTAHQLLSRYIKVEQLVKALTTYGSEKLTDEAAQELVSQLEPDSHGLINYQEYVEMMMSDS